MLSQDIEVGSSNGDQGVCHPSSETSSRASRMNGNWLEVGLGFDPSDAALVISAVEQRVASIEQRRRVRKDRDLRFFRHRVEAITANALWASAYRISDEVRYFRQKDFYKGLSPSWLRGGGLAPVVDLMETAGLLHAETGRQGQWPRTGTCSRFAASRQLTDLLTECKLNEGSLQLHSEWVPLIRMKDEEGRPQEFDCVPTEAAEMYSRLLDINEALAGCSVAFQSLSEEYEDLCASMVNRAIENPRRPCSPEFFRMVLYRSFNEGQWDKGGRFYGGWWQNIPSLYRKHIVIDGEPTCELDFEGCSVRTLYHLRGLDYADDPYLLDELGSSAAYFRPSVKRLAHALINGEPGSRPHQVSLPRRLPTDLKPSTVVKWIRAKHGPVADAFNAGEGLNLQSLDARIAEGVMLRGLAEGMVVLPIHDSFVVNAAHKDRLRSMMIDSYQAELGYVPVIN